MSTTKINELYEAEYDERRTEFEEAKALCDKYKQQGIAVSRHSAETKKYEQLPVLPLSFPPKNNSFVATLQAALDEYRHAYTPPDMVRLNKAYNALRDALEAAKALRQHSAQIYADADHWGRLRGVRDSESSRHEAFDQIGDDLVAELKHRLRGLGAVRGFSELPAQGVTLGHGHNLFQGGRTGAMQDIELGIVVRCWCSALGLRSPETGRTSRFAQMAAIVLKQTPEAIAKRFRDRIQDRNGNTDKE